MIREWNRVFRLGNSMFSRKDAVIFAIGVLIVPIVLVFGLILGNW